jgi:hypothetical protein
MPFYRMNGIGTVHIKGTKLPKPCAAKFGIGDQQQYCMDMSAYLCDGPVGGGRTCDRALCDAHAFEVGKNKHYCPECRADHIDNPGQGGLFTSLVQS